MTRFNRSENINKTVNLAGGKAFAETPKLEFASILLTSFVQDQFYRSATDTMDRVQELLAGLSDKKFAAKAAIYARNKFGMRSITHVVAGELAPLVKGEQWLRPFYDKVVYRVDDITEILAYYLTKYGKPIPNAMKRGLADSFAKFNAYQLAKYRGEGKAVSLVDAVNLVRPMPFKNEKALKDLVNGTLKSTETWETGLTQAGQKAESEEEKEKFKKDVWISLIKEKKLGYFALLRNLRNIIEQAPEVLDEALETLKDPELIKKSLVLPFRYYSAYRELSEISGEDSRKAMKGVAEALDLALVNVPKLEGSTLVAIDHSGSMDATMSDRSSVTNFQVAALLGVALAKTNDADIIYFGDSAKYYNPDPTTSVVGSITVLDSYNSGYGDGRGYVGHGTNFSAVLDEANRKYDRIMFFSDMQGWLDGGAPMRALNDYKNRCDANPHIYSFDLAGHGTLQFPQPQTYCLAGFSEKIFDILKLLEADRNALVNEIEKVEL